MIKKFYLESAVFVCGAAVMAFELTGARVLAPYAGTSLQVWTNLIGVILASLSLGYYLGGKAADRRADAKLLSLFIFMGAVAVGLTALSKDLILSLLAGRTEDSGALSLCASLALFAPANVFLGMISPYAAKLKIRDLYSSGSAVGCLYAVSSVGSIAGTFVAGFFLIPRLGNARLLILIAFILGLLSLAVFRGRTSAARAALLFLLMCCVQLPGINGPNTVLLDMDTLYNRLWVYGETEEGTGRPILALSTDPFGQESAVYLDGDDLVFDYMKFFRMAEAFVPGFKRALMIGGAAYSYPCYYLSRYAGARIDVVEIDPALTKIAGEYFKLRDDPRLVIRHEDGRMFLNRGGAEYDLILIDAFKDTNCLPYHLTTVEAVREMAGMLAPDGMVMVNIIGAIEGRAGRFTRAEYLTYKTVFPSVMLFPVDYPADPQKVQNIILAALKSRRRSRPPTGDDEIRRYLGHLWEKEIPADVPVLTDDRAPVEYYLSGR